MDPEMQGCFAHIRPREGMRNPMVSHMMAIPIRLSQKPIFIIWGRRIKPDPYMIALGGVATGSMKAKLQPIALPSTGGSGLTAAAFDMAMIIGINMLADAVLDVSSVRKTLNVTDRRVMIDRLAELPPMEMKNFPMASAKPVSNI